MDFGLAEGLCPIAMTTAASSGRRSQELPVTQGDGDPSNYRFVRKGSASEHSRKACGHSEASELELPFAVRLGVLVATLFRQLMLALT